MYTRSEFFLQYEVCVDLQKFPFQTNKDEMRWEVSLQKHACGSRYWDNNQPTTHCIAAVGKLVLWNDTNVDDDCTVLYCVRTGVKLTDCKPGDRDSFYRLNRLNSGHVRGIVRGIDDASMTIVSYGNKNAIMKHQDDPLISLSYASNKRKFSTAFVPKYWLNKLA